MSCTQEQLEDRQGAWTTLGCKTLDDGAEWRSRRELGRMRFHGLGDERE